MKKRKTKQPTEEKAAHEVTPAERAAVDNTLARHKAKPWVRLKVSKNGSEQQVEIDHADKQNRPAARHGDLRIG